jgi:ankyrin repeat protein
MTKQQTKKRGYRRNTKGGGNCLSSGTCSSQEVIQLSPQEKLFYAVDEGELDKAREAIDEGANVNDRGNGAYTPLYHAVYKQDLNMVNFLLSQKNIDVNVLQSRTGTRVGREYPTALDYASTIGNTEIVNTLLRNGAKPNMSQPVLTAQDDIQNEQKMVTNVITKKGLPSGFTELTRSFLVKPYGEAAKKVFNAIKTDRLLGVKKIIETEIRNAGVTDSNVRKKKLMEFFYPADANGDTFTFLMSAASVGNAPIVKYLLDLVNKGLIPNDNGVNYVNIINKEYKLQTALHIAMYTNNMDIANMLLDNPSTDINIVDSYGFTPVLYAIFNNNLDLVKKLVNKGAVLYGGGRRRCAWLTSLGASVNDDVFKYMLTLSPERLGGTYDNFMTLATRMLAAYVSDKDASQAKLKTLQQYIADHSRTGGKSRSKRRRRTLRKKGKKTKRNMGRRARK